MSHLPFGHLTHLLQCKKEESSYRFLLSIAREIIANHQRLSETTTFLAEDLWMRDRKRGFFGTDRSPSAKTITALLQYEDFEAMYASPVTQNQYESRVMELIRAFLNYAVERGDMYRAPLVGSRYAVIGYAFTVAVQAKKF